MADGIVASILGWLRAGYPEGVPSKDCFPLLALLRRTVGAEDFARIVQELQEDGARVATADIREAIERVTAEEPLEQDVRLVAARLAAVGWPLSGGARALAEEHVAENGPAVPVTPEAPSLLSRVIAWLRVGYPEGVPTEDYIPMLGLLRRRLSDEEVEQVAQALAASAADGGVVSTVDAQVLMSKVTDALPSEEDVQRVAERLGVQGSTLA